MASSGHNRGDHKPSGLTKWHLSLNTLHTLSPRPLRRLACSGLSAALLLVSSGCSFITAEDTASDKTAEASNEAEAANVDGEPEATDDSSGDSAMPEVDLERPPWLDLDLELVLIGEFLEPIGLSARPGSSDLYVIERAGVVRRIERTFTSGAGRERIRVVSNPVLDISELVSSNGERGLLGITFSTDGRFMYVSYSDLSGDSVVDEYDIGRTTTARVDSRREIIRVEQPFINHNGGSVVVGDDGFLYLGLGDGGSANDPDGNGQNPATLLGSVLRLDTVANGDDPYTIPSGNPFAADPSGGAPEVFLWGVRNPWRFSFDRVTGDLWLADVGQDAFEEINFLAANRGGGRGGNLGWGAMEGFVTVEGQSEPPNHTLPIFAYSQEGSDRCSVTGGYVYRGELIPLLEGVYLYGDYCSGEIFALQIRADGQVQGRELPVTAAKNQLVSFGEGSDGEIYVIEQGGQVLRLQPKPAEPESE